MVHVCYTRDDLFEDLNYLVLRQELHRVDILLEADALAELHHEVAFAGAVDDLQESHDILMVDPAQDVYFTMDGHQLASRFHMVFVICLQRHPVFRLEVGGLQNRGLLCHRNLKTNSEILNLENWVNLHLLLAIYELEEVRQRKRLLLCLLLPHDFLHHEVLHSEIDCWHVRC